MPRCQNRLSLSDPVPETSSILVACPLTPPQPPLISVSSAFTPINKQTSFPVFASPYTTISAATPSLSLANGTAYSTTSRPSMEVREAGLGPDEDDGGVEIDGIKAIGKKRTKRASNTVAKVRRRAQGAGVCAAAAAIAQSELLSTVEEPAGWDVPQPIFGCSNAGEKRKRNGQNNSCSGFNVVKHRDPNDTLVDANIRYPTSNIPDWTMEIEDLSSGCNDVAGQAWSIEDKGDSSNRVVQEEVESSKTLPGDTRNIVWCVDELENDIVMAELASSPQNCSPAHKSRQENCPASDEGFETADIPSDAWPTAKGLSPARNSTATDHKPSTDFTASSPDLDMLTDDLTEDFEDDFMDDLLMDAVSDEPLVNGSSSPPQATAMHSTAPYPLVSGKSPARSSSRHSSSSSITDGSVFSIDDNTASAFLSSTSTLTCQPSPKSSIESLSTNPIVRPPFPSTVLPFSPITGLSSTPYLRVCFRTAEALNTGCAAARANQSHNLLIELYARVVSTARDESSSAAAVRGRQFFELGDLWSGKGPVLKGVYEGWKGANPWEYDCGVFLEESEKVGLGEEKRGRMCRVVGRLKREEREWVLRIESIWEAGWEDVEYIRRIICA